MDQSIIAKIQSFGFDVYMRQPDDNYLLYVWKSRIGYLQKERFGGVSISTVHIPNSKTGTGFRITDGGMDDFNKEDLERGFLTTPSWASDTASVKKWEDIEHFRRANRFNAAYQLVPPVTSKGNPE